MNIKPLFPRKDLRKSVLKYLAGNKLMSLGTSFKDKPWSATLFFAYDKNFNLIFYSRQDTKHSKNISRNPFVSATISQDWGRPGFVKGIQISGKAYKVDKNNYRHYYAIFKKRYPWAKKFPDHTLYLIKSSELFYLDRKLFGHFFKVKII